MVKQKSTSSDTEKKYRWIQYANPLTATWEQVKPGTVTNITTSGYTNGGYGGLYKLNSNTYFVIANGTKGNWFGAIGAWSTYNGGIPGYPNTSITTGYLDLYIRLYGGFSGTQGTQGYIGDTGTRGNQGPQGYVGNTGITGNQGTLSSVKGRQGHQGNQGTQGYQGYRGTQGATGGTQGNQGTKGDTGTTLSNSTTSNYVWVHYQANPILAGCFNGNVTSSDMNSTAYTNFKVSEIRSLIININSKFINVN